MSTDAGSVRVSIFNQSYSLRSADGDGEHILRVARIVDERMRAIASGLAVHDVAKVAVITALNLADELEGLKNFYESELRDMLARAREEEEAAAAPEAEPVGPEGPESPEEFEEPRTTFAEAGEQFAETREPHAAPPDDVDARAATQEEQSWFDSIFDDSDAPSSKTGDERLSSQVASRLRSQVSARLRRLRQPSPGNITEGEGGDA
ncbi:MAG TPA: cell division protein ZapA [Pyrinomonadaceae bacterium]|nr:cell division protein ZapA [Pyrinomonadaceae bacterium]